MSRNRSNSSVANQLTPRDIDMLVDRLVKKGHLVSIQGGKVLKCTLKCGQGNYPQITFQGNIKPLVHHVYWRYKNDYKPIPEGKEISHLTGNVSHIWPTVAESAKVNENRKGCHDTDPGLNFAARGKCPHEPPCLHVESE